MPELTRVIAHWTVTRYKCDDTSREHYHFIYEGDGTEIAGRKKPEDNLSTKDGVYAAHTLDCNTGSIGVSCAAMFGATSIANYGPFPITKVQFEAMCQGIARLCKKYGIPVTPKTVLTHAEVQGTLGIKQRGKWDIAVLPFAGLKSARDCGDYMRERVAAHIAWASKPAPTVSQIPPKPIDKPAWEPMVSYRELTPAEVEATLKKLKIVKHTEPDVRGIAGIFKFIIAAIAAWFKGRAK